MADRKPNPCIVKWILFTWYLNSPPFGRANKLLLHPVLWQQNQIRSFRHRCECFSWQFGVNSGHALYSSWGLHWNFDPPQCLGLRPEILDRCISLSCLQWLSTACHEWLAYFHWPQWSCDWSHGPDRPMLAAILENFHCEQPCYGFLGLIKFLCSQT